MLYKTPLCVAFTDLISALFTRDYRYIFDRLASRRFYKIQWKAARISKFLLGSYCIAMTPEAAVFIFSSPIC